MSVPAGDNWPKKEIRILPQSDLEILKTAKKLTADGKGKKPSPYNIAKLTHRSQTRVEDVLERIEEDYPLLQRFIKEVARTGYFQNVIYRPRLVNMAKERYATAAQEGYYIGNRAPFGYRKSSKSIVSDLLEDLENFLKAQKIIFSYYVDRKTMKKLAEEFGLTKRKIRSIVHENIRIYGGYVRHKGNWYRGRHKKAYDEEFWLTYIKPVVEAPKPRIVGIGSLPTGLKWLHRRLVWDTSLIPRLKQVFELAFEGNSVTEIARKTGFLSSTVSRILRNPKYANRIKIPRKPPSEWGEAGVEPLISFEEWLKVQDTRDKRPLWLISKEIRRKNIGEKRIKLLRELVQKPLTTSEIAKTLGFSVRHAYGYYLNPLRLEGLIEKRGRTWYIKTPEAAVSST
jgi:hypothetical protein